MNSAINPRSILVDQRWRGPHGIGRFAEEVISRIPGVQELPRGLRILHPLEPLWLSTVLISRKPACYFSPGFNPPLYSPVPFIFTIHDLIHLRFPQESNLIKRLYYQTIVRGGLKRAYKVLTVSEFSKHEIVRWSGVSHDLLAVVGNGVSDAFRPDGPRMELDFPYLLYVGNSKPHKNLSHLLRAFAALRKSSAMRLMLVAEVGKNVHRLIDDLQLQDCILLAGPKSDAELAMCYRGAIAFVSISLYEGFSLPPLEAIACGTPTVVSDIPPHREVLEEAAIYVDGTNIASIVDGLATAMQDEARRQRLIEQGIQRANHFTWEKTAEKVMECLSI